MEPVHFLTNWRRCRDDGVESRQGRCSRASKKRTSDGREDAELEVALDGHDGAAWTCTAEGARCRSTDRPPSVLLSTPPLIRELPGASKATQAAWP